MDYMGFMDKAPACMDNFHITPGVREVSQKNVKPIHCNKIFTIALIGSSVLLLTSTFFSYFRTRTKINSNDRAIPSVLKCPTDELSCNQSNLQSAFNYLCMPGSHTRNSVVVGSRIAELDAVNTMMKSEPALKNFAVSLYQTKENFVIPEECRAVGDALADQMFSKYIDKYRHCGLNETNAVLFSSQPFEKGIKGAMFLQVLENQLNTWRIFAIAETNRISHDGYVPAKLVAHHELMHVEETSKLAHRKDEDGDELLATLTSIMQIDEVYKNCKKMDLHEEVDYKIDIKFNDISIAIGKIANYYRSLNADFGNLVNGVLSPESIHFIKTGIR